MPHDTVPGSVDERPEALAVLAASGDRAAFEQLVRRFESPLVAYLFARCGDREDALELTQETFLRAWSSRARYDRRWRYSTWLYTIATRLATSRLRSAGSRPGVSGDDALQGAGIDDDPAAHAAHAEARAGVWSAAREVLSEEQRSALWLRYVQDLSAIEIGEALGRRPTTVRVILFRARARLAAHLESLGALELEAPSGGAAVLSRRMTGETA